MRLDAIAIDPPSPEWVTMFETERRPVEAALHEHLTMPIEHMGSTSVPGLAAKPIIDMLAVVADYDRLDGVATRLAAARWLPAPEPGDEALRKCSFCFPSIERRTHHLHVVEQASAGWSAWLLFRDYLRQHPEAVARYADLKKRLAGAYALDREAYRAKKAPMIEELLDQARSWQTSPRTQK